ncbi:MULTISPECIES: pantoate--beta-alanine ligase [unclassified Helicobacter]|uniref:pantoate--beta-alanine ligase n=1 Tax=unclassified Helicobacter TaxID=2593540 RepID=UPI000CF07B33|nr:MULTISPECIES: pantoate--beta-alanine ligase [unclassified Helicobacter]
MQILKTIEEVRKFRASLKSDDTLGLVPTMGALHQGHQSLVLESKKHNTRTLVSIFVNPTQFGINEDFDKYPRVFDKDCKICESLGVDAIFAPTISQIYQKQDEITLNPPKSMGYVLEGFIRENHFNGVLQIVLKLFNLTQPHFAYFGQKDAQQLLILKRLIQDMFLPIEIVSCPTIRDTDGLALSSRNVYLSQEERKIALEIPQALQAIQQLFNNGETSSHKLLEEAKKYIKNVMLDYLVITDLDLKNITSVKLGESLALIAGKVGNTRLLDNLWF